MISVIHAGLTIGIAIFQKILFSEAPSSRADSRTASVTEVSMNRLIKVQREGGAEKAAGTITAKYVSTQPRADIVRKLVIPVTVELNIRE